MSLASLEEVFIKITDQVEREEAARDISLNIDNSEVDPPNLEADDAVHLNPFQPRSDDVDNSEDVSASVKKSTFFWLQSIAMLKKRVWTIKRDFSSLFMQVIYPLIDVLILLLLIGGDIGRTSTDDPPGWSLTRLDPYENTPLLVATSRDPVVITKAIPSLQHVLPGEWFTV
jgi:hypothetical protein